MSMLKEKLLDWNWYKNKIPLYLQNSYGYQEHFKIFYDILVNLDESGQKILNYLDITNVQNITDKEQSSDILDFIGNLYSIKRKIKFYNKNSEEYITITLSDNDFLKILLVNIFQINYDGTRKSFLDFYEKTFGDTLKFYINKEQFKSINVVSSLTGDLKAIYDNTDLLFVNIMGINYHRYKSVEYDNLARFDYSGKMFDDENKGDSKFL